MHTSENKHIKGAGVRKLKLKNNFPPKLNEIFELCLHLERQISNKADFKQFKVWVYCFISMWKKTYLDKHVHGTLCMAHVHSVIKRKSVYTYAGC